MRQVQNNLSVREQVNPLTVNHGARYVGGDFADYYRDHRHNGRAPLGAIAPTGAMALWAFLDWS